MKMGNLMGMPLDDPLVVAPGPWTRGIENMKEILLQEPGAVITESIVSEAYPDVRPRYSVDRWSRGVQNIRIYSGRELENWLDDLTEINQKKRYGSKTKIIASIMGTTASEIRYIAKKVEKTGVDGIELGLACPMGEGPRIVASDPALVFDFTKAVVDAVSLPVSVKLGAGISDMTAVVKAAENAGASGISAIDALRCILGIDIETGQPTLPTYGGYSGAPIRPIGLAAVAGVVQSTDLPVLGIGGITGCKSAVEYIMAGAASYGVGTEILLRGFGVIRELKDDLNDWMRERGIATSEEIRGAVLSHLHAFEEIDQNEKTAVLVEACRGFAEHSARLCADGHDGLCMAGCLCHAIQLSEDGLHIDRAKCDGCGLCVSICPDGKIQLSW